MPEAVAGTRGTRDTQPLTLSSLQSHMWLGLNFGFPL